MTGRVRDEVNPDRVEDQVRDEVRFMARYMERTHVLGMGTQYLSSAWRPRTSTESGPRLDPVSTLTRP